MGLWHRFGPLEDWNVDHPEKKGSPLAIMCRYLLRKWQLRNWAAHWGVEREA